MQPCVQCNLSDLCCAGLLTAIVDFRSVMSSSVSPNFLPPQDGFCMEIADERPSRVQEKLTLSVAEIFQGVRKLREGKDFSDLS